MPGNSSGSSLVTISSYQLSPPLTQNTNFYFRVRARSTRPNGTAGPYSNLKVIQIFPAAPYPKSFYPNSSFTFKPACPGASNGAVSFQIDGIPDNQPFKAIVTAPNARPFDVMNCLNNGLCGPLGKGGDKTYWSAPSTIYSISDLPAGKHKLWLVNAGGNRGSCYGEINIEIPEYQPLKLNLLTIPITCPGANDGSIKLGYKGGSGRNVKFYLKKDQGTEQLVSVPSDSILRNLNAGIYQIRVEEEECQGEAVSITLIEPTRVTGAIVATNSTCIKPGQEKLEITSQNSTSGQYRYILQRNRTPVFDISGRPATLVVDTLSAGDYSLSIRDSDPYRTNCAGFDTTFVIDPPPPLSISEVTQENILCHGAATGKISFKGNGGVQRYRFEIFNLDTREGQIRENNAQGIFENLIAGKYILTLRSGIAGCTDFIIHTDTIVLTQPPAFAIQITSTTDVKCYNDETGSISATVSGGVGNYQYNWQQLIGQNLWAAHPGGNQLNLENVGAGKYRLRIVDGNNCEFISEEVTIAQPEAAVKINNIEAVRPGCIGNEVKLKLQVSGGVGPYRLFYAPENSEQYVAFNDNETLISIGRYHVKAIDQNACEYVYPEVFEVTSNALAITTASIPVCYKQTNGKIKITVKGGEAPYKYSIDNGQTFQDSPDFNDVAEGAYTIKVEDSRGCSNTGSAEVGRRTDTPEIRFLVTTYSQALDTLALAEVSYPKPDSVKWDFDPRINIVRYDDVQPYIQCLEPGNYTITLTAWFASCEYSVTKTIEVSEFDPNNILPVGQRPITQFKASPNPNSDGNLTVEVNLWKRQQLILTLHNLEGDELYYKHWEPLDALREIINLPADLPEGVYILRVLTDNDVRDLRIVVQR